ncbi:MAG: hypothetical protein M1401_15260 [Chloroflexi bacterium]|nr:hypothetical protein [Chloroflexota bacterium]MCL5110186.1 hypothetical protein [Chloroflexota bacterium]
MAEKKRFLLRLSPELWEEINRWAAQDLRSVNAQIEFVLRRAVDERRRRKRLPRDGEPNGGDREAASPE